MKELLGIEHIGVRVSNMDKSIAFYRDVLGLPLRERVRLNDEVELAFLVANGAEIELIQGADVPVAPGQVDHLAFTVRDIDTAVAHVKQAGVRCIDDAPREILDGRKIFFFYGPDGERLEFFQH